MSLAKYLNEKNIWRAYDKKPNLDINNLSEEDRVELRDMIEGDLSPENLCCDGEASPAYVRARGAELRKALQQLNKR